jgi:endonuclease YncB( thermonuclease family)
MKKIIVLLLTCASLFAYPATVIKHIDGDTITVKSMDGNITKLRFADVDTPEKFLNSFKAKGDVKKCNISTTYAGVDASKHLADVVHIGDTVEVKLTGDTSHDRDVAIIYMNGVNLNELMVKDGYAYVWHSGRDIKDISYRQQLLKEQYDSKEAKLGLWGTYPTEMQCLVDYHK